MCKFFFNATAAALFLFFVFLFPLKLFSIQVKLESESAILINAKTGRVLFEKDGYSKRYPASTTKIATVLYALKLKPSAFQEKVTASKEALRCVSPFEKRQQNYGKYPSYVLESDGSTAGVKIGEVMTFQDLLYATMLESGNDSSNVLAEYVGNGSITNFMEGMNRYIQTLGCKNTNFCNPHGLPHPDHATTAWDLAVITQQALSSPVFRKIVKTVRYERPATNKQPKTFYDQTNRLLRKGTYFCEYAIGVKTGSTSQASRTLVAAAQKEDRVLIAVLLKCQESGSRFKDAKNLFEAAFKEKKIEKLVLSKGDQTFACTLPGAKSTLTTFTKEPLLFTYYPSDVPDVRCQLVWEAQNLPIAIGQKVGEVRLLDNEVVIGCAPLFAKADVVESWFSKAEKRVFSGFRLLKQYWLVSLVAIAVLIIAINFSSPRRK